MDRLREKEDISSKREKERKRKEDLTRDIQKVGLWTTVEETTVKLGSMQTLTEKKAALKAQIMFRKSVLAQKAPAEVFALSKSGKQHSVDILTSHLVQLFSNESTDSSPLLASTDVVATTSADVEPAAKRTCV